MASQFANRIDEHDEYLFRCPNDLAVTEVAIRRILLVGVCTASHLTGMLAEMYKAECDFVHIATLGDHSAAPPRPIADYDFQVLILPMDYVMPAHIYFRMQYSDLDAEKKRFDESISELNRFLYNGMRWNREHGLLTIVGNFLVPQQNPVGRSLARYDLRNPRYYVECLNQHLATEVEAQTNAYLLDIDGIAATFGKKYLQDDSIWADCHGAFITTMEHDQFEITREGSSKRLEDLGPVTSYYSVHTRACYRAICAEIITIFRSVRNIDAIKLVVIDLDDTAWRGIAAEEQNSKEFLTIGWPLGFVEALMYLKRRGILISIISKNTRENALSAWGKAYGDLFPIENFVSTKINWKHKSENMQEILAETNLLPRSVLYIDDNPVERGAIQNAFPDIRVLGANPYYFRRILLWSAELQQIAITAESARRTEMVQSQIVRETSRNRLSNEEFLESLALKLSPRVVRSADDKNFPRMLELLNKTNQFNTTGRRWSQEELLDELAAGMEGYTLSVEDKFTNYGLVCVALVKANVIEQFVMSCRVIGLGVELTAISIIETDVMARKFSDIRALAKETTANILSRDLYQKSNFAWNGEGWVKPLHSVSQIPAHVTVLAPNIQENA